MMRTKQETIMGFKPEDLYIFSRIFACINLCGDRQRPKIASAVETLPPTASGKRLIKCELCYGKFDETSIVSLPCHDSLCGECCLSCAKHHFELKIKCEEALCFKCPICEAPNADSGKETLEIYFEQLTAVTIPRLKLSSEVMDLYHRKISINWMALHNDEVIYCPSPNCSFLFMSGKHAVPCCPKCKVRICGNCKNLYDARHKTAGCEELQIWKGGSDPNSPDGVIAKCNFLVCPKCKAKLLLERGGCDHMTCPTCNHQFCRCCLNPFTTTDEKCLRYQQLKCKKGLHGHHPRNCWFFLRDEKTEDLQQLLRSGGVQFEKNCKYFEGRGLDNAEALYKEYLVHEIRKHGLDPASMNWVSSGRLKSILSEEGLSIPSEDTSTKDDYRKKLRDAISRQLPLPRV